MPSNPDSKHTWNQGIPRTAEEIEATKAQTQNQRERHDLFRQLNPAMQIRIIRRDLETGSTIYSIGKYWGIGSQKVIHLTQADKLSKDLYREFLSGSIDITSAWAIEMDRQKREKEKFEEPDSPSLTKALEQAAKLRAFLDQNKI